MKSLALTLLFLLPALAFAQPGSPASKSGGVIAVDSIPAATQWHTFRIDSVWIRATNTMRGDTSYYADRRFRPAEPLYQLQINVLSSAGRTDTIMVKRLMSATYNVATDTYDSVWVVVPLLDLITAKTDSIGVVKYGPYSSTVGGSFRYGTFLVYDINGENGPWRIERRSGKGHPVFPDAAASHTLKFEFFRKKSI